MCLSKVTKEYAPNNNRTGHGWKIVDKIPPTSDDKYQGIFQLHHRLYILNKKVSIAKYKRAKRIYDVVGEKTYIPGFHLYKYKKDAKFILETYLNMWPWYKYVLVKCTWEEILARGIQKHVEPGGLSYKDTPAIVVANMTIVEEC